MSARPLTAQKHAAEPFAAIYFLGKVLLVILALGVVIRAGYMIGTSSGMVRWPHEAIGGEATMMHESQLLSEHGLIGGLRLIYGPQGEDSFTAGNYPPLYMLLWSLEPGASGFPTGRLLSILSGIGAALAGALAIYAGLARRTSRTLAVAAGLFGGGAFICTVPVFQQMVIAKPDMVALALAAVGLAIFEFSNSRWALLLAGTCFALGLLTKQSLVFALLAALIAAYRREPRSALRLALTTAAIVVVVIGALWLIAGPSLFERLVLYNARSWQPDRWIAFDRKFLALHWLLLLPALGYCLWGLRHRATSALTYFPLLSLATLITVGTEGGSRNYYIELCLAAGLAAALALGTMLSATPRPRWLPVGALTVGLIAIYVLRTYTVFVRNAYIPEPPVMEGAERNWVLSIVDATPDPILADDSSYLAIRDRPVIIDDNFLCTIVREKGLWDDSGIVADLEAQRYPLVLTVQTETEEQLRGLWGDAIVDALQANYDYLGDGISVPKKKQLTAIRP